MQESPRSIWLVDLHYWLSDLFLFSIQIPCSHTSFNIDSLHHQEVHVHIQKKIRTLIFRKFIDCFSIGKYLKKSARKSNCWSESRQRLASAPSISTPQCYQPLKLRCCCLWKFTVNSQNITQHFFFSFDRTSRVK